MSETKMIIEKPEWFPKNQSYESFLFATIMATRRAIKDGEIPEEVIMHDNDTGKAEG